MRNDNQTIMETNDKKIFTHDCDKCQFLGNYKDHDLYFCEAEPTVIARYGNKGYEYISGLIFAPHNEFIGEAKRRAIEKGLLK